MATTGAAYKGMSETEQVKATQGDKVQEGGHMLGSQSLSRVRRVTTHSDRAQNVRAQAGNGGRPSEGVTGPA